MTSGDRVTAVAGDTIVLTGASSGIGAELARQLAGPGKRLVLVGRDAGRLGEVETACRAKGATTETLALDLCNRQSVMTLFRPRLRELRVDTLILNAGILAGRRSDQAVEAADVAARVLQTNLVATIDFLYEILPGMLTQGSGRILFMASLAGLFPLPDAAAYSASKAGLIAYGVALREALLEKNIHVTVACPGYVTTPLIAGHHGLRLWEVSPETAVQKILKAFDRNRAMVGFPSPLYWSARAYFLFPYLLRRLSMALFRFHLD